MSGDDYKDQQVQWQAVGWYDESYTHWGKMADILQISFSNLFLVWQLLHSDTHFADICFQESSLQ